MGTRYARSWVLPHVRAFSLATFTRGYFHTVELPHSLRSLVGTSTRSSFLTRYARSWVLPYGRAFSLATLARGYFHTVELSHSLRSLVGTSPRSSFLTRYARLWSLPHSRAFSLATLARGYFHTLNFREKNSTPKNQKKTKTIPWENSFLKYSSQIFFCLFARKLSKRLKNVFLSVLKVMLKFRKKNPTPKNQKKN